MLELLRVYLRATSWPIIVAMLALMSLSLLAVHQAEQADADLAGYTVRQAIYVVLALAAFMAATAVHYQKVGRTAYLWFGLTLILLIVVLRLPEIRFSHRWIRLGPVQFQPSELAKLTYILAMAWYLRYRDNYRRVLGLIPPFVLTVIPAGLILIEPDLGTTLLLFPTLLFMLFMAGAKLRHLGGVVAVAAAVILMPVPRPTEGMAPKELARRKALAYWSGPVAGKDTLILAAPLAKMHLHQLSRIEGWLRQSDKRVAADQGFQLRQSLTLMGSGGLTGHGTGRAADLSLKLLPDDHTDFIYAVVGGQWGFVGAAGVLLIYVAIFICGAEIAAITQDPFGRLLVVGVLGLLFAQVFINVGMTMGLMPITGMTLPLVSFGGSSMVVNAVALGLLVNVGQRRAIVFGRRPFEFRSPPSDEQLAYNPILGDLSHRRNGSRKA